MVDLDNIAHNYREINKLLLPDCMVMASVKADAYGHGDVKVAVALERAGVSWFGVSNIEEALSLRRGGIASPILVFGYTPAEYAEILSAERIAQTVYCPEYGAALHLAAQQAGVKLDIHIKIDTGMSRIGFLPQELDDAYTVCTMPNFNSEGIFTHFACADEDNKDSAAYTRGQFDVFCYVIDEFSRRGIRFSIRHACNSGGTILYPDMHMDMVRPGIELYGLTPSEDLHGKLDLRPVMEWYSCVTMVKELPDGTPISYGRTAITKGVRKIATVAAGYADGYSRLLSNRGKMIVRGGYAPVVGRVCMDQLMLDVTDISGVAVGDIVTIAGEGLTLDEIARMYGTVSYETACLVGKRVPRTYRQAEAGSGM